MLSTFKSILQDGRPDGLKNRVLAGKVARAWINGVKARVEGEGVRFLVCGRSGERYLGARDPDNTPGAQLCFSLVKWPHPHCHLNININQDIWQQFYHKLPTPRHSTVSF